MQRLKDEAKRILYTMKNFNDLYARIEVMTTRTLRYNTYTMYKLLKLL